MGRKLKLRIKNKKNNLVPVRATPSKKRKLN